MKVITLWQPWAQFIVEGWKTIETRLHNRFASLVGQEILIHAGLKWDPVWQEAAGPYMHKNWIATMQDPKNLFFDAREMGGHIIGRTSVVSHRPLTYEDSPQALIECNTPRFGLVLAYTKPATLNGRFIKAQGKQGIWEYNGRIDD